MTNLVNVIRVVAVLVAAIVVGNWFLAEVKLARSNNKPWYQPYLSIPGLLIFLALLIPVVLWMINK